MMMTEFDDGACPECGGTVFFGFKEEASGWKTFAQCEYFNDFDHDCSWEVMAGWVTMSELDHQDEKYEKGRDLVAKHVD